MTTTPEQGEAIARTSMLHRLLDRALGVLPTATAPTRDSTIFVVALVVMTTLAMLTGEHHRVKGDPLVSAAWRLLVHGAWPLSFIGCFFALERRRGIALGALGIALSSAFVLARVFSPADLKMVSESAVPALVVAGASSLLGIAALVRAGVSPASFGIGLGDTRFWVPRAGLALVFMVPALVVVVLLSDGMQAMYPMYKPARTDGGLLAWHLLAVALDFVGWELLFRGVLLFGLLRRGDAVMAILLPAVPFCLLHGNKPAVELVMSLLGGIVSGWFTISAKSVVPLWMLHVVMVSTVSVVAFALR
jgi:membrane protease YdiL (CAAX protease family)